MVADASSFTNKVLQATYSLFPTRNCVWTNWKMCRTKWQSYFAEPRNGITELSRQHAGWCEQHARAPLFISSSNCCRTGYVSEMGSATMLVAVAGMLPALSGRRGVLTDAALPSTFHRWMSQNLQSTTRSATSA